MTMNQLKSAMLVLSALLLAASIHNGNQAIFVEAKSLYKIDDVHIAPTKLTSKRGVAIYERKNPVAMKRRLKHSTKSTKASQQEELTAGGSIPSYERNPPNKSELKEETGTKVEAQVNKQEEDADSNKSSTENDDREGPEKYHEGNTDPTVNVREIASTTTPPSTNGITDSNKSSTENNERERPEKYHEENNGSSVNVREISSTFAPPSTNDITESSISGQGITPTPAPSSTPSASATKRTRKSCKSCGPPTSWPTTSSYPSVSPSTLPSSYPSSSPSSSNIPSSEPSNSPSSVPSSIPSNDPTSTPESENPENPAEEKTLLDAQDKESLAGEQEKTEEQVFVSACPEKPDTIQEIEVDFKYSLTISPGSKSTIEEIVAAADKKFYEEGFNDMVECRDGRRKLLRMLDIEDTVISSAVGFTNAPVDKVTDESCGTNCYVIKGGSTILIPNDAGVEPNDVKNNVLDYFMTNINDGAFNSIHEDVTGVGYRGAGDVGVRSANGAAGQGINADTAGGDKVSPGGAALIAGASLVTVFAGYAVMKKRSRRVQMSYHEHTTEFDGLSIITDNDIKRKRIDIPKMPGGGLISPANTARTWVSVGDEESDDADSVIESPAVIISDLHGSFSCSSDDSIGANIAGSSKHDVHNCVSPTSNVCPVNDAVPQFVPATEPEWDNPSTPATFMEEEEAASEEIKSPVGSRDSPSTDTLNNDSDDDESVFVGQNDVMSAVNSTEMTPIGIQEGFPTQPPSRSPSINSSTSLRQYEVFDTVSL